VGRNDRFARLFRLIEILARSRRGLPLARIAENEGWKLRSLYRDIEALQLAGFPIVQEAARFRLMEGFLPAAQIGIDSEELLALHLASQQAAGWSGTRLGDALRRLYGKLATPGKGTGKLLPPGLGKAFTLATPGARDYSRFRDAVSVLDRAAREHIVVDARYESVDGVVTKRAIEPAQLHWDSQLETLYVIAWCRLRKDIRIFATHRFQAVSPRRETFEPRPDVSSQTALKHAFRVWRADRVVRVRLRFIGRAARLAGERRWHASQKTAAQQDGSLLFEADVAGLDEIMPWILSFGSECAVLEPADLRERVRDDHARAAGLAEPRSVLLRRERVASD
jgi:predicted DNA-binding transcriptional regulator YafY